MLFNCTVALMACITDLAWQAELQQLRMLVYVVALPAIRIFGSVQATGHSAMPQTSWVSRRQQGRHARALRRSQPLTKMSG